MVECRFGFVGQTIRQDILAEHFDVLKNDLSVASNNFYAGLLEGLVSNGYGVDSITFLRKEIELVNKPDSVNFIRYDYKKNSLARYIKNFTGAASFVRRLNRTNKDKTFVIFNVLRIGAALGGLLECKIRHIPTIGVVTDVPGHRIKQEKTRLFKRFTDWLGVKLLNKYDMYVFLSEPMREVILTDDKPYVIIEGIYDEKTECPYSEKTADSDSKFTVIYAGSLHYKYGIMNLVNAVMQIDGNIVLKVFGNGEALDEIKKISSENEKIVYGGFISRDKLIVEERNADLLVNPRPVDEDYTKYSFPSKNLEYMASATPTLLTNISSLPEDYKDYVILAEDNSVECLKESILNAMALSADGSLAKKGQEAREFILREKNAKKQSYRIIKMVDEYCK